jgi:hypothetical protein
MFHDNNFFNNNKLKLSTNKNKKGRKVAQLPTAGLYFISREAKGVKTNQIAKNSLCVLCQIFRKEEFMLLVSSFNFLWQFSSTSLT